MSSSQNAQVPALSFPEITQTKMRRQPLRRCGEGGLGAFLFSSPVTMLMELVIFSEHPPRCSVCVGLCLGDWLVNLTGFLYLYFHLNIDITSHSLLLAVIKDPVELRSIKFLEIPALGICPEAHSLQAFTGLHFPGVTSPSPASSKPLYKGTIFSILLINCSCQPTDVL